MMRWPRGPPSPRRSLSRTHLGQGRSTCTCCPSPRRRRASSMPLPSPSDSPRLQQCCCRSGTRKPQSWAWSSRFRLLVACLSQDPSSEVRVTPWFPLLIDLSCRSAQRPERPRAEERHFLPTGASTQPRCRTSADNKDVLNIGFVAHLSKNASL